MSSLLRISEVFTSLIITYRRAQFLYQGKKFDFMLFWPFRFSSFSLSTRLVFLTPVHLINKCKYFEETMEKKSFKKHSLKEQESSYREQYIILDERYTRIKEILKQVLTELRELKAEKQRLTVEYENLSAEVKEKDALLERMQSVSEAVIDEYSALKVKCDLETEAASNAIKRATKYFQENQKLKRHTRREVNSSDIPVEDSSEICSQESDPDENISELDVLNKLTSELRTEIANLKIQLGKEVEKQNSLKEDFEIAKSLYEQEMKDHNCTKEKLQSFQLLHNNARDEDGESENSLQRKHMKENGTESLHPQIPDIVESFDTLTAKFEFTEQEVAQYKEQNNILLNRIRELECQIRKLNAEVSASDLLPIPPPPPPPPLPPPSFNPIKSLITFIHAGKKTTKTLRKENIENTQQKAMSEMIDAIKKGNIQLKPTPKATLKKKNSPVHDGKLDDKSIGYEGQPSPGKSITKSSQQEAEENFSMSSDIDDELKVLLRKQSIKIETNNSNTLDVDPPPANSDDSIIISVDKQVSESITFDEKEFKDTPENESASSAK
ncbi:WH2 domain-containing protein [Trichonephila inaurata madagascariensis]|uniref:WH2 domain-containing protein n=1 Tax=Trichonephila inaurata madagascariensis TaxID=2747483 RepID=A0A8X6YSR8_9ARAC|nr:WH2 domain-containing protein [Trichonephila inaurata madagascariensis]